MGHAGYAFYSMQPLLILTMLRLQRGAPLWNGRTAFFGALVALTTISLSVYFLIERPARRAIVKRVKWEALPSTP